MTPWKLGVVLAAGHVSLVVAAGAPPGGGVPVDPTWQTDYPAACRMARQEKKPLFVVFR